MSSVQEYLAHHGIKGQKWGVRRYQNEDGSLTEEGKRKYNQLYNKTYENKEEYNKAFDKFMKEKGLTKKDLQELRDIDYELVEIEFMEFVDKLVMKKISSS